MPRPHCRNQTQLLPYCRDDLGHAIVNFARIVPDGLLVFFPSYGQLKACMDAWKAVGPGSACTWDRITK